MKINILLSILVLSLIFACSDTTERERIVVDDIPVEELHMETLMQLPDQLAPNVYMLSDHFVLLLPYRSSTILRVYNVESGELISDRLSTQESKMEITADKNIRSSVSFFNKSTTAYSEYEIANGELSLKRNTSMNIGDLTPEEVIRVKENMYITLGDYKQGLFSVMNNDNQTINFFGRLPFSSNKFHPDLNIRKGYISMFENQLVYASQYFGYISSYQFSNGNLKKKWDKEIVENIDPEKDTPVGFHAVTAGKKYIYTLYTRDFLASPENATHSLIIFNHKGKPVVNCLLPGNIKYFAVDEQEKFIYATYEKGEETWLVRYPLPVK